MLQGFCAEECKHWLCAFQVNGKMRGTVEVPKGVQQAAAEAVAREEPSVAKFLDGKDVKKVIFVPGRILNFIVPSK